MQIFSNLFAMISRKIIELIQGQQYPKFFGLLLVFQMLSNALLNTSIKFSDAIVIFGEDRIDHHLNSNRSDLFQSAQSTSSLLESRTKANDYKIDVGHRNHHHRWKTFTSQIDPFSSDIHPHHHHHHHLEHRPKRSIIISNKSDSIESSSANDSHIHLDLHFDRRKKFQLVLILDRNQDHHHDDDDDFTSNTLKLSKNPIQNFHHHRQHQFKRSNLGKRSKRSFNLPASALTVNSVFLHQWPNTMNNVTATLGRNATFECVFPQLKDFKLVWLHQDHSLLAMHDSVISKNGRISVRSHANTTFYLTIHEVQESDRGFYLCQVNTKPMRIQIGYLEVNVPPSFIEEETSGDSDIIEGSSVDLRCDAIGRPEPEINWRRENGQLIVFDSKLNDSQLMVKGRHLNLTNVTRQQMGAYLCIASNGIPPTISKRIFLGVSFTPKVLKLNSTVKASIGSSATLECILESYPRSNILWQKSRNQSKPIIYSDHKYSVFINESTQPFRWIARLKIINLEQNDFDKYTCSATNHMGTAKSVVNLIKIERKPMPMRPKQSDSYSKRPSLDRKPSSSLSKYSRENDGKSSYQNVNGNDSNRPNVILKGREYPNQISIN
ncbi:aryl hydrocarbon receptor nuclear translocator [Sarcoptes scabiei]|nr:aryl hydrocarbon receptor nuclear translocator [Sarcoptes scabiei]